MADSPFVYIVAPPNTKTETEYWRIQTEKYIHQEKWETNTIRLVSWADKSVGLYMTVEAATKMYRNLHRRRCAVVQIGTKARIPLDPRFPKFSNKTMSLETFVFNKTIFVRVNNNEGPADVVPKIALALKKVACTGERDPRCLPMHLFNPKFSDERFPMPDLDIIDDEDGAPKSRLDWKGRLWMISRPPYHGQEILEVNGKELQKGFHWDVKAQKNPTELISTSEIWQMPPKSYLNVYPDAAIRGGQSSAVAAKRIYPPRRPSRR